MGKWLIHLQFGEDENNYQLITVNGFEYDNYKHILWLYDIGSRHVNDKKYSSSKMKVEINMEKRFLKVCLPQQ